jgi:uracil-DNA glycosylase
MKELESSWLQRLGGEFQSSYMQDLKTFLLAEKERGKVIYPRSDHWFRAFELAPFDQVRVVILGQDPYHGEGQAHGLCFSVPFGQAVPPSLRNIYKELEADLSITPASHGCLVSWAEQGVLLLNSVLTVEQSSAGSHQNRGWENFTDQAIRCLSAEREGLVFLLWGAYAQKKGRFIDTSRHLVLEAAHPSPLSAYRGFFGCQHFSKTNAYLRQQAEREIEWRLPLRVGHECA